MAEREPILVHCEGSHSVTHFRLTGSTTCSMCGRIVSAYGADMRAVTHERPDILAMAARGDFG